MATRLQALTNIRMTATISPMTEVTKKDFENYFRTFKKPEEYVEDNSFISPFFCGGEIFRMNEHYGDRKNAMDEIAGNLRHKRFTKVNLCYDFRFVPPNIEYETKGDFPAVKWMIESALRGTGLYIFFLVSHFGQLVGNPLEEKPEHYHLLLCGENEMSDMEYEIALNQFAEKLERKQMMTVEMT